MPVLVSENVRNFRIARIVSWLHALAWAVCNFSIQGIFSRPSDRKIVSEHASSLIWYNK